MPPAKKTTKAKSQSKSKNTSKPKTKAKSKNVSKTKKKAEPKKKISKLTKKEVFKFTVDFVYLDALLARTQKKATKKQLEYIKDIDTKLKGK